MARARKPKPPNPLAQVQPGDTFAMPLANGRWGVCRVVQEKDDNARVCVVTTAWTGDAPPTDLSDPRLRTVLLLTHHSWTGRPCCDWVSEAVPADFVALGNLPVTEEEAGLDGGTGGWPWFPIQAHLQWRWDNEREAVLAEDEAARQQAEAATRQTQDAYRPSTSLRELRQKKPLANWSGFPSPANIRLARRIVRELIDELIALEDAGGDEVRAFDAFRRTVERFNDTEDSDEQFIETVEREDMCEALDEIAEAAGLGDHDVSAWRDW